ncbi:MAG: asparaginase [Candidatus Eremiobacteraeota bacterium]|nr:asparaginase [Candidatus Eremiobacteraeota bacterium]
MQEHGQALDAPYVVEVWRGRRIESRHRVAICAVDADDNVLLETGTVDVPVFLRSTAKPFIAAASVRAGAVDAFGFDEQDLALMCASHAGEEGHVAIARSMLEKSSIPESALLCGGKPSAIYNNCSGKHAGILALCKYVGAPLETYLEPANPAQQLILAFCERVMDEPFPPERIGVDGCGIPVIATSLRRTARAFARVASLTGLEQGDADALGRCRRAMAAYPWCVSGTGRFDTALIEASAGAIVGKGGAEAVHGSAIVPLRAGVAIKVIDGSGRATAPAVLAALAEIGALNESMAAKLVAFAEPPVRNVAGRVVGAVRATVAARTP